MATMPVIDDLDRCKIALQYVAERHSAHLDAVLDLLLKRLDAAIGQVHTQLRQCTCPGSSHPRVTSVPVRLGILTVVPERRQTPRPPAPLFPEGLPAGDDLQSPNESHTKDGA